MLKFQNEFIVNCERKSGRLLYKKTIVQCRGEGKFLKTKNSDTEILKYWNIWGKSQILKVCIKKIS